MVTKHEWWSYSLWVLAAGGLGFILAAVFAGWLRLPRAWFLAPCAILAGVFLYAYLRWSNVDLMFHFRQHWLWGVVGALLAGAFVVKNVLSQPPYPRPAGAELLFDLVWLGAVYGTVDALLLSVMPILATWQAFSGLGWTGSWPGKLAAGGLALAASLLVTVFYHLGYPEFRGSEVVAPVIGNGSLSLAYLLTTNPISAVAGHIAMHSAAVLHGLETTVQLPPHY